MKLNNIYKYKFIRELAFEIFQRICMLKLICRFNLFYLTMVILLYISGCKKLVDVDIPITSVNASIVYNSDETAIATLTNIYTQMSINGVMNGITAMSYYPALSADELVAYKGGTNPTVLAYYNNALTPIVGTDFWNSTYSGPVFFANAAIEGLTLSTMLTPAVKQQLLGEAKFIRAFCYFYLVNMYGDIPLVLSTDYKINSSITRSPKSEVYKQIIQDLEDSQNLMSENYLDITLLGTSSDRVTPNKWAATALIARVFLYNGEWSKAEAQSSAVIENRALYDTVSIDQVFLINNKESIWQLQSVDRAVSNTSDAYSFILPSEGPDVYQYTVYLSNEVVKSFQTGDKRKEIWIDSVIANGITYYYPTKYKINELFSSVAERTVILRLAEQYLIRSEARVQQGNIDGALTDLNIIRSRAGLSSSITTVKENLLKEILHERQVELFTEWGHRWLDLKRYGLADAILKVVKGSNWQNTDQLYPIPFSEIVKNNNLKNQQNPGY